MKNTFRWLSLLLIVIPIGIMLTVEEPWAIYMVPVFLVGMVIAWLSDLAGGLASLGAIATSNENSWLLGTPERYPSVTLWGYLNQVDMESTSPNRVMHGSARNPLHLRALKTLYKGHYATFSYEANGKVIDWTQAMLGLGAHIDPQSGHLMYEGEILD